MNLISNALKYTKNNKLTEINIGSILKNSSEIVIFIQDNGVGFDMSKANNLFKVFERLHSEKDFPGTGIGLAIVKRIINRHGGKVWAESVLGKGSTFYISFPVNVT
jgi:signal transduction histidine kinase